MEAVSLGGDLQQQSLSRTLRAIKRESVGLFSCIASILQDATFVAEIRCLYPHLPLLANLRCGLWYAREFDGTAYYKSTDGHSGNWSFSLTRLNLHVATAAGHAGGAILLDATRRGKPFPDAFNKTVPIWCTVLNRALALARGDAPSEASAGGERSPRAAARNRCADGSTAGGWDTSLHLPLWVSEHERQQIEARLDTWVQQLLESGADLQRVAAVLHKPLRPLWVNQATRLWVNQVADPADLPFTPLLLLSASLPNARGVRSIAYQCPGGDTGSWTFDYMPGAGDDEESWARGLTPQLLWQNHSALVAAGPPGVHDLLQQLLAQRVQQGSAPSSSPPLLPSQQQCLGNGSTAAGLDAHGIRQGVCSREAEEEGFGGVLKERQAGSSGLHNLAPAGCRGGGGAKGQVVRTQGGLYWLGSTGIALGCTSAAAAAAPVWTHVDAVLNCGTVQSESLQGEPATLWQDPEGSDSDDRSQRLLRGSAGPLAEARGSELHRGTVLSGPLLRYMWLPMPTSKKGNLARKLLLQQRLPAALAFASQHVGSGHRLLIHCDDGQDVCVCVAVALLLECYSAARAPYATHDGNAGASMQNHVGVESSDEETLLCFARVFSYEDCRRAEGLPQVSKQLVRQTLALVSGMYPPARPTQASLRQVYNFFHQLEAQCAS